jgi:large subunit ribosomal protein L13
MVEEKLVIDAEDGALGRIAAYAAKQSLLGKRVIIVNVDKAVITGRKDTTLELFMVKRKRGAPIQRGPNYPSDPEKIVKRTIRGMLSYKQERGRRALQRIKCYVGIPDEVKNEKMEKMETKTGLTVGELARLLRGKGNR